MNQLFCGRQSQKRVWLTFVLCLGVCIAVAYPLHAQYTLEKLSIDTLHNTDSVHRTEVEPDFFSWGNTIVGTFHVARVPGSIGWGSGDVGWATSTDGGQTWKYGILPALTKNYKKGPYGWAADPSVAYDAKHGMWLISTLPLAGQENSGLIGDVAVSRSTDGLHWDDPVIIDKTHEDDKNWTTCDNTSTSPYYGNCYTEWDQAYGSGEVLLSVSSDGGKTWTAGKSSGDGAQGLGAEPQVQPNGTVIVPFVGNGIDAFESTDGGKTWSDTVSVAGIDAHEDGGGIRNPFLLGANIDGGGKVYVVWADCRFRSNCSSNDVVMSTSSDGKTWSSVVRIPIDKVTSTVDHFLPGIGANPTTSGDTANLTIVYYYYPVSNCSSDTCKLDVGFTTSSDGGKTWTAGTQLAGPMKLSWLPVSDQGPMVADYIGVTYNNGNPFGIFEVATAPTGSTLHEATYTTKEPLLVPGDAPRFSSADEKPVPGAKSDFALKFYLDDEHTREIPHDKLIPRPNQK